MKVKYLLFIFILFGQIAYGQIIIPNPAAQNKHLVFANSGLEPQVITTIGYRQLIREFDNDNRLYLGGSVKSAPLAKIFQAWRLNLNQTMEIKLTSNWHTIFNNAFYLAFSENRAGTMNGLGFKLNAAAIHKKNKWSKGIIAAWQHTAFSKIKHSEAVKDSYRLGYHQNDNPLGPFDGWYKSTGNRFKLGVVAGRPIFNNIDLQMELGSLVVIQKQGLIVSFAHAQVPAYFNVQVVYWW
jgi:hypothetical protein